LEEDATRVNRPAVIVSSIDSAQLPATTVVEVLKEAVLGSSGSACLNGIAAVLLPQPDGFQMSLTTIRRLHETAGYQSFGCIESSFAQGSTIGCVERDQVVLFH
jgi:hypothetical protein